MANHCRRRATRILRSECSTKSHTLRLHEELCPGGKNKDKDKSSFSNICLCLVLSFVFVISASPCSCGNRTGTPPTWSVSGHLIRHKVVFPSLRSQQIIRSVPQLFSTGVQILSAHPFRVTNESRPGQPPHRLSDWCPLHNRKSQVFHPSSPWRLPRQRGFRWRGSLHFQWCYHPLTSVQVCVWVRVCAPEWLCVCVCVKWSLGFCQTTDRKQLKHALTFWWFFHVFHAYESWRSYLMLLKKKIVFSPFSLFPSLKKINTDLSPGANGSF